MTNLTTIVQAIVDAETLPPDLEALFSVILDTNKGVFEYQETDQLDYKNQFPFSKDDPYYESFVRLVCAFNNTFGGIIVFGVHDKLRTPGHNKVKIDIENENRKLATFLNNPVCLRHRRYEILGDAWVDIVLVPKRKGGHRLTVTTRAIHKQPEGVLWYRQAAEVLRARPETLPFLLSSRSHESRLSETLTPFKTVGAIPPNPAIVKQFVGRLSILHELYSWASSANDPIKFLTGKGGSGKTTIAYEFSKLIVGLDEEVIDPTGRRFDRVIFLSAKEKELNTATAKQQPIDRPVVAP
jgi:hypothetical protein